MGAQLPSYPELAEHYRRKIAAGYRLTPRDCRDLRRAWERAGPAERERAVREEYAAVMATRRAGALAFARDHALYGPPKYAD